MLISFFYPFLFFFLSKFDTKQKALWNMRVVIKHNSKKHAMRPSLKQNTVESSCIPVRPSFSPCFLRCALNFFQVHHNPALKSLSQMYISSNSILYILLAFENEWPFLLTYLNGFLVSKKDGDNSQK